MGALSMALTLALQTGARNLHMPQPLFSLAGNVIFAGALLGLGAVLLGGVPLVVSAWRSTPRSRFLFLAPFLTCGLAILITILHPHLMYNDNTLLALTFYGVPLIGTIAINRAIRQAEISDESLRFATIPSRLVVLGMLLMLVGVILWGFALALFAPAWFLLLISPLTYPWNSWLLIALGMLIAVVVALWASSSQTPSSQPSPHDDSPSSVASSREQGYDPVDPSRE